MRIEESRYPAKLKQLRGRVTPQRGVFPIHRDHASNTMVLQTESLLQVTDRCIEVAREAADANNSDLAALVGCQATPGQRDLAEFRKQGEEFRDLAKRLQHMKSRIGDKSKTLNQQERHVLLDDLRMVLTAIRVATFDIGLHGRDANLTDTEISDELKAYAWLDYQLRGNIIPWLKEELGVTETKAL